MCIRNEDPRPYLKRTNSEIINLNGEWNFDFDDENIGHLDKWFINHKYSKKIEVPFPFQSKLSGINDQSFHDDMWYHREFQVIDPKDNYILNFNGVDYYTEVYINGVLVYKHSGASTRFYINVKDYIHKGNNDLTLFVHDSSVRQDFPRGKQYWKEKSETIFYTRTSGIYKNVYLEIIKDTYIEDIYITPNIDEGTIKVVTNLSDYITNIEYEIKLKGEVVTKTCFTSKPLKKVKNKIVIWNNNDILESPFHNEELCWTPENPILYELTIRLVNDDKSIIDEVSVPFGMRKISTENGLIKLNNRPYYQKLCLIQGYFKDGLLSYPSVESLIKDILDAKKLGFNGCRVHQKVEDPIFYHLCDKLGFICWLECPSGQVFNTKLITSQTNEWIDIVKQNFNFTSILTYVPLNESWGVPNLPTSIKEQSYENALYFLTKAIDDTRLVVGNDGWELTFTDICSVHNYKHGKKGDDIENERFILSLNTKELVLNSEPGNKKIYLDGYKNFEKPIMLTEFGGISFISENSDDWGYTTVKTKDDLVSEYSRLIKAIKLSKCITGYCYTQLYDVEQETNGLLTYEREFKVDPNKIKEINDSVSKLLITQ